MTDIKKLVRDEYGQIAERAASPASGCSCCSSSNMAAESSLQAGYSPEEINSVPEGANLGLGCGNPLALAEIKEGETVLDLGSGGGFDCFLASPRVGEKGKVIGVDMTPQMLSIAKRNAFQGGYTNVEFIQGEIENLPLEANSIDLIISNCVINLSPDKPAVFKEAMRVLKPGGRIVISDIVLEGDLPDEVRKSAAAYVSCIAGAEQMYDYLDIINDAGFVDITLLSKETYGSDSCGDEGCGCSCSCSDESCHSHQDAETNELDGLISSLRLKAYKPL
ncbi:arsenite S-adenosylmethyltransferase [Dehalococcoides mccartyi]|jgi:SAM-dependent methyltransferase|uniref:Arsenite methyltransferase n=1 Tax=Dehalococcoides mccartyi TaxID=61435 RepID=A0A2J1DWT6_9CHLR|nr:arsenite methyltransferase [Dehalococcoides mccartyi]AGG06877.1 putative arsenite S-adenosylmethyltransferase [Dehalococcoides mccartyi DCMB5]AGG08372.1 putative arsenite S-adenosylmethyltransferase [Dehalococcoides mccartyi BTF08]KSV17797.1 arsenite S-adenosylmethyltransferase [Dehalococcoides mccartyi]PKH46606.1 arsenite S-adenosylmethyltransferase [Dehalococcoides mccartyi]PKH47506.1 arsenite S-adenosylmethyltransferase [Dehalococcoides mccartyi]